MPKFGDRPADKPRDERHLGMVRVGNRQLTAYHLPTALKICEEIAQGKTLTEICGKENGMPARFTFSRWVLANPELARAYHAARELSAFALEEEALDLAREIKADPGSGTKVRAYEVAMSQLRWSASRRNPRVYSERAAIQITVPIQINTPLDMGLSGGGPGELPGVYTLDATVVLEPEPQQVEVGPSDKRAEMGDVPLIPRPRSLKAAQARKGVREARNAEAEAAEAEGPEAP